MTTHLIWEDPPAVSNGRPLFRRAHIIEFGEQLKKHPGRWARVAEGKSSGIPSQWRKILGDDRFEVVGRRTEADPKKYNVYARWTGAGHTLAEHDRPPTTAERTPRRA